MHFLENAIVNICETMQMQNKLFQMSFFGIVN